MTWASSIDTTLINATQSFNSHALRSVIHILLLAIVPLSTNVTADGSDENSGITITASFDNSTEMTTLNITMPETNNATLLDELKDETFSIERIILEIGQCL